MMNGRLAFLALFLSSPFAALAQSTPPKPDHVVIVIEENHDYSQINGSASAPYINSLKTQGAWFTSSHAIEHCTWGRKQRSLGGSTSIHGGPNVGQSGSSLYSGRFAFNPL